MSQFTYTTVDRILSKLHRELKNCGINEGDAIDWIAEALDFLEVGETLLQEVAFLEVKNHEACLPEGFKMVLQIARNNEWTKEDKCIIPLEVIDDLSTNENSEDTLCNSGAVPAYIPNLNVSWGYNEWTSHNYYKQKYTPVRLADHTFFNSIVCKEKHLDIYQNCDNHYSSIKEQFGEDEYTIVGTLSKKLRFSFEEGYVALAYVKGPVDNETGYPLIPDEISHISAITYYIKWKIKETEFFDKREGSERLMSYAQREWLKYCKQAKNYAKMPKSIDDLQDLLEQTHYLIPRRRRYYGFFGNLNQAEKRRFNDPDNRKKLTYYNGRQH